MVSILSEILLEKAVFCFCKQRQLDISFLVRDRYPSLLSPFSTRNISGWNLCRPCACCPCEFSGHSVVSQACCIWRTLISLLPSILSDSYSLCLLLFRSLNFEERALMKTSHLKTSVSKLLSKHNLQLSFSV